MAAVDINTVIGNNHKTYSNTKKTEKNLSIKLPLMLTTKFQPTYVSTARSAYN